MGHIHQDYTCTQKHHSNMCQGKVRVAEIGLQAHRRGKHQPTGPTNTRDNQMAKGKCRNIANSNQVNLAPSKPNSPTTASPEYSNTPEKQDLDLKSQVMMLMEGFKKDIITPLKK